MHSHVLLKGACNKSSKNASTLFKCLSSTIKIGLLSFHIHLIRMCIMISSCVSTEQNLLINLPFHGCLNCIIDNCFRIVSLVVSTFWTSTSDWCFFLDVSDQTLFHHCMRESFAQQALHTLFMAMKLKSIRSLSILYDHYLTESIQLIR